MKKNVVAVVFGMLMVSLLLSSAAFADKYWDPLVAFRTQEEILTRLDLSEEVRAKVDAVYSAYKDQIKACQKEIVDANREITAIGFSVGLSGEPGTDEQEQAFQSAMQKRDDELYPKLNALVKERDDKVREALPPELQVKFDRGTQLIAEWDAQRKVVCAKYDRDEEVTEQDKAYEDEFEEKIDAEVGLKRE